MTDAARSRPARPRRTAHDRVMRANRIFARMMAGQAYAEIAGAEGLSVRRVGMIVREALDRWDSEPHNEYRLVEIARLGSVMGMVEERSPKAG
jgi:hypothetical protein